MALRKLKKGVAMKTTALEILGTFFLILGLSITPDYGNATANLTATIIAWTLGVACFTIDKIRRKNGKKIRVYR